jgi:hypothetical protein
MEKDKKIEEPFDPEKAPNPPQSVDPNKRRHEEEQPEGATGKRRDQKDEAGNEKKEEPKRKLLGESEIEIDDATTI